MRRASVAGLLVLLSGVLGWSQQSSPTGTSSQSDSTAAAIHELQQQVNELRSAMAEMRSETEQYRAENAELRRELKVGGGSSTAASSPAQDPRPTTSPRNADPPQPQSASPEPNRTASLEDRIASLEESSQL